MNKVGKLTEHEWEEIQRHPAIGCRILSTSYEMLEFAEYTLAHHEKCISLADSYDAMTNERPYRKALSEEIVIEEIRKNSGVQFDPELAKLFVEKVLGKSWRN